MKEILTIAFIVLCNILFAQNNENVYKVILKNGSIIKGFEVERNESFLKIRTYEGHLMVFDWDDIADYKKEIDDVIGINNKIKTFTLINLSSVQFVFGSFLLYPSLGIDATYGIRHHGRFHHGVGLSATISPDYSRLYLPFTSSLMFYNKIHIRKIGSTPYFGYSPMIRLWTAKMHLWNDVVNYNKPLEQFIELGYHFDNPAKKSKKNISLGYTIGQNSFDRSSVSYDDLEWRYNYSITFKFGWQL